MAIPIVELTGQKILAGGGSVFEKKRLQWLKEGYLYRADALGCESLAESVVSEMLKKSTVTGGAKYEPVVIRYQGRLLRGSRCKDFRDEKEEIITVERLYRTMTGLSLAEELKRMEDAEQRLLHTVQFVENTTGVENFGTYLSKLLEVDAFFLNAGRSTENIALLYNERTRVYSLCPIYGFGGALCACRRAEGEDERGDITAETAAESVKTGPFSEDFAGQMSAAEKLYGRYLYFNLRKIAARGIVDQVTGKDGLAEDVPRYTDEEIEWMKDIVERQAGAYGRFFR